MPLQAMELKARGSDDFFIQSKICRKISLATTTKKNSTTLWRSMVPIGS